MGALPRKENGCLFFLVDEKQKLRISLGTTFCRFIFNFSHIFSASNMSREYYDFVSFPIFAVCLTYLLLTFFPDSFFFFFLFDRRWMFWLDFANNQLYELFWIVLWYRSIFRENKNLFQCFIWCITCQKINTSLLFRCRVKS